jgi:hypothetical protein
LATCQRGDEKTFKIPALVWQPAGTYSLNIRN